MMRSVARGVSDIGSATALATPRDPTHFLIFRDFVLVVINDEMIVALKRKSD